MNIQVKNLSLLSILVLILLQLNTFKHNNAKVKFLIHVL